MRAFQPIPDSLDVGEIRRIAGLHGASELTLEVYSELPSTSRLLMEKCSAGEQVAPFVIIADWQTGGVGRRGKSWLSVPGNISFSVLDHFDLPVARLMAVSLVTGVTVATVLRELAGIDCRLKWPNDVIVENSKLAGLLIEVPKSTAEFSKVVTGIGINYKLPDGVGAVGQAVTSIAGLCEKPPSRNDIIGNILGRLQKNYQDYQQNGLRNFVQQWHELDYLYDKPVRIIQGDSQLEGVARGVSENGELLVWIDDKLRSFHSGEVSVRRR